MQGVVAAGDHATASAAERVLRDGGNAVDAAIAAAAAAFVAEPMLCSAGGGGLMAVAMPGREPEVIDFFSDAPGLGAVLHRERLDFESVVIDFGTVEQEFHVGRGAAAVPGALDGLALAHQRHGSRALAQLVAPACAMAREGVVASAETALTFELLWPILSRDSETVEAFTSGRAIRAGELMRNVALADTFDDWARVGRTPDRVVAGLLSEFGAAAGGCVTEEDIHGFAPAVHAPLEIEVGRYHVDVPPGVGGQLVKVIVEALLADTPRSDEAAEFARFARASARGSTRRDALIVPGSTTHISVMDAEGGVCAVTLSNGEGSGHVIAGTGIQVNNFLGEHDLNPHGFHCHRPGERMPTMMAPTVVRRAGEPALALGTGGANRIRTALGQVIYRVLCGHESLEDAIAAPRAHGEGEVAWAESAGLADVAAAMRALKSDFSTVHEFNDRAFFFGGVHAVGRDLDGVVHGVGDDRRGGVAVLI